MLRTQLPRAGGRVGTVAPVRAREVARRLVGRPDRRRSGPAPDGADDASVRLLVDAEHYARQRGRPVDDPVVDYLVHGWHAGFDPHPLFSTAWYLDVHRDVADASVCPLVHYARHGWRESRQPHPLFDPACYRGRYPDLGDPLIDPLVHFMAFGGREGRDPNAWFDSTWYRTSNPDVAAAGVVPVLHYLDAGWREGRAPHPDFDVAFYRSTNPDVAGGEPLTHFLTSGERAGREPRADFAIRRLRRDVEAREERRRLVVVLGGGGVPDHDGVLARCPTISVIRSSSYEPELSDDVHAPDAPGAVMPPTALLHVALCLAHLAYDFVVVTHDTRTGSHVTAASPANAVVVAGSVADHWLNGRPLPIGSVGRILHLPPAPAGGMRRMSVDELGLGRLLRVGDDLVVAGDAPVQPPVVARRRPAGPLLTPGEPGAAAWLRFAELGPADVHDAMRRAVGG
jgi:hypothetical protein